MCHLDVVLTKMGGDWSRNDTSAATVIGKGRTPCPMSSLAEAALRTIHEEAERLLREHQVAVGHG